MKTDRLAECIERCVCEMRAEREEDGAVIDRALAILQSRLRDREVLSASGDVKAFLRLQAQGLAYEVFGVLFLDASNRLIAYEQMFRGTLTQTAVYPREVLKRALELNAASVILHHNHPSGTCEPSAADVALTRSMRLALALVEVEVLDHIVTSDCGSTSLSERGILSGIPARS